MRKFKLIVLIALVAGALFFEVPAQGAAKISNGVSCSKSGSITRTSNGTYKCAKNPLSSSTKLTWLSTDCITSAKDAVNSEKAAVKTIATFKQQVSVLDAGIAAQNAKRAEIQTKLDLASKRLLGAQTKLSEAKTDAVKKLLNTAVASWTSATKAYSSKLRNIDTTIKQLESSKAIAVNKPAELQSNLKDARESAKLLCTKGF